ncbi:hypothetical protein V6R21_10185 [Limibacter armeniacum]|uniref:hypothetical protein n=1 Tax=Limibacter armeniacum TaxID=466084 RepID=UPI002FE51D6A
MKDVKIHVRRAAIGLLSLLMLVNAFAMSLIFADYELRKEYIAEVLCVNRNRVELACAGKCYLKKQLNKAKQAEEQQKKQETSTMVVFLAFPDYQLTDEPFTDTFASYSKPDYFTYDEVIRSSYFADILQPPRILS